ncbi:MAG TPA: hypothetical protein VFN52_00815, partial [Acidiferrobacteraceae bacterium]|nr:hypothetical protein [Acidiferrobacteraceae bacterium]
MARSSARRRFLYRVLATILLLFGVALGGYTAYLNHIVRSQFERKRWALPARVYASPLTLYPGAPVSADDFSALLRQLQYVPARSGQPGTFMRSGGQFSVVSRPFRFTD